MKAGGYGVWEGGGSKERVEINTFTCSHCNRVVLVMPNMKVDDLGGGCRLCMKFICSTCVGKPCVPFEKKMEEMEARDRFRRFVGGG